MRVRVSGNGGAASSTVQCGGCAGGWVATRRRAYTGRPVNRGAGIGPAGLTRDPRARKTDDRQTTVADGPADGGGGGSGLRGERWRRVVSVCVSAAAVTAAVGWWRGTWSGY
ncbi:hypothetical protein QTP88_007377 [Uroleucon formosanum]